MNHCRSLAIAALLAATACPTMADEQKVYVNPFLGFQLFDNQRHLSETDTYGIGLEYRMLPRWAVEGVFSRGAADRKGAPGESDFNDYRLDGLYYFADPDEALNPYLATGAGHTEFERLGGGSDNGETRLNFGGGLRYNVSDVVSLRGDIRELYSLDEDAFDTLATVGMSFAFGVGSSKPEPQDSDNDGVNDDTDQCPGTPAGASVDATGCELDSDGDGVPNSADQCPATPAGARVDSTGCELDSDNDGVVDSKDQCPGTKAGAKVDETGCEGVMKEVETFTMQIKFPTNSSVIDNSYDADLRQVADFLRDNPGTVVEIGGYTDNTGKASYNEFLSQRRAESVAGRLVNALGVSADRVTAKGYGESDPVASNDTASGRAQNRRVEAKVQKAQ